MQLGQIYYDARRYDEAIAALESLRTNDTVYRRLYLAASHAAIGRTGEAQRAVERILQMDPEATIARRTTLEMAPYKDSGDLEHFRENLRRAGLRE
jgi:adenylate cyclase